MTLPSNIDIAKARLPATYEQAKVALESCVKVDECKTWANKAAALATYAKMADDDSLLTLANRIQARAVSRMGELLKQFNNGPGRPKDENRGNGSPISQAEAGRKAGLSPDQIKQAVRVANIPTDTFESMVESDNPPTVTALAEMGKKVSAAEQSATVTKSDTKIEAKQPEHEPKGFQDWCHLFVDQIDTVRHSSDLSPSDRAHLYQVLLRVSEDLVEDWVEPEDSVRPPVLLSCFRSVRLEIKQAAFRLIPNERKILSVKLRDLITELLGEPAATIHPEAAP